MHCLQHLFSTRIDPMFDGLDNSVCEVDVVPSDAPTGSEAVRSHKSLPVSVADLQLQNFAGNAFETRKKFFDTTADGVTDAAPEKSRVWTIVNENKKHYASKLPVGYKVGCRLSNLPTSLTSCYSLCARIYLLSYPSQTVLSPCERPLRHIRFGWHRTTKSRCTRLANLYLVRSFVKSRCGF